MREQSFTGILEEWMVAWPQRTRATVGALLDLAERGATLERSRILTLASVEIAKRVPRFYKHRAMGYLQEFEEICSRP